MKKVFSIVAIAVIGALFSISICPAETFASSDSVTYGCIKKGNYVYCGVNGDIYKVNVKTNKKSLFVNSSAWDASDLSMKNNYLYYIRSTWNEEHPISVYRTSLSSKKTYRVVDAVEYYIAGNVIYYAPYTRNDDYDWESDYDDSYIIENWAKADLDGNFIEETDNWGPDYSGTWKASNAKGYKLVYKYHNSSIKETAYLKKSNGKKIKLKKYDMMNGVPYAWVDEQWYGEW